MRTMAMAAFGLACALAMPGVHADAGKGYSGTWLAQAKTGGGRNRIYAGVRLQIEDTGTAWTLKTWRTSIDKEVRGWDISGSLDGKSCKVDHDPQAGSSQIGPLTCKLSREADMVVMDLNREVARTTQRFRHTLSGDGQTLTVTYELIEPSGAGMTHTIDTRKGGAEIFRKDAGEGGKN